MRSDSVFLSVWVSRARACDQMKMLIVVSVSALLSLSLSLSPPSPHSIARSLARLSVARVGSRFAADERVRTARGPLLLRGRPGGSGPGRPSLRPSVPSPLSSPFLPPSFILSPSGQSFPSLPPSLRPFLPTPSLLLPFLHPSLSVDIAHLPAITRRPSLVTVIPRWDRGPHGATATICAPHSQRPSQGEKSQMLKDTFKQQVDRVLRVRSEILVKAPIADTLVQACDAKTHHSGRTFFQNSVSGRPSFQFESPFEGANQGSVAMRYGRAGHLCPRYPPVHGRPHVS